MRPDKKAINDARFKKIAEQTFTPEGRIVLEAHMWHPLPRGNEERLPKWCPLGLSDKPTNRQTDKPIEGNEI